VVAHELTLSFVPDVEQRLWRTIVRTKYQLTRNRVQLQNRLEALLEEAHIKLSSLVSDLLGASARRMLEAIAGGEINRETLAALADRGLRATQQQLQDALGVCQAGYLFLSPQGIFGFARVWVRSMYRRAALANAKNSCAGYFRFLSESAISKSIRSSSTCEARRSFTESSM
jgi:transposase